MMGRATMRRGTVLLAGLLLTVAAQAQTRTLVLSTYGLNNDLFKKHVYEPF